jgi:hypothetical protein
MSIPHQEKLQRVQSALRMEAAQNHDGAIRVYQDLIAREPGDPGTALPPGHGQARQARPRGGVRGDPGGHPTQGRCPRVLRRAGHDLPVAQPSRRGAQGRAPRARVRPGQHRAPADRRRPLQHPRRHRRGDRAARAAPPPRQGPSPVPGRARATLPLQRPAAGSPLGARAGDLHPRGSPATPPRGPTSTWGPSPRSSRTTRPPGSTTRRETGTGARCSIPTSTTRSSGRRSASGAPSASPRCPGRRTARPSNSSSSSACRARGPRWSSRSWRHTRRSTAAGS